MTLMMELKEQWREGKKEGIKEASAKYEAEISKLKASYETELATLRQALRNNVP